MEDRSSTPLYWHPRSAPPQAGSCSRPGPPSPFLSNLIAAQTVQQFGNYTGLATGLFLKRISFLLSSILLPMTSLLVLTCSTGSCLAFPACRPQYCGADSGAGQITSWLSWQEQCCPLPQLSSAAVRTDPRPLHHNTVLQCLYCTGCEVG